MPRVICTKFIGSIHIYGPNIKTQSSHSWKPQAVLTWSQLIKFNSVTRCRLDSSHSIRHSEERKTPLPQYLGILIHNRTCKKELMDTLFDLGLCISYDRVMAILTILNNKLLFHQIENKKVICTPNLFINVAIDDPSSSTAKDSFHGTGISLFQHTQSEISQPTVDMLICSSLSNKTLFKLPQSYSYVPPVTQSHDSHG